MATTLPKSRNWPAIELLAAGGIAALLLRPLLSRAFAGPAAQIWATMFVSLTVQALPFLVLGVLVSGAIAAFMPAGALARTLPRRLVLAVPAAGLAGVLVPGCECSSVPVAARLIARDALTPAALAFMLAAPALNPVRLSPAPRNTPASPPSKTIERSKSRSVAHYGRVVIDDCLGDRRHLAALGILAREWFAWQPVHRTVPNNAASRRLIESGLRGRSFSQCELVDPHDAVRHDITARDIKICFQLIKVAL